MDWSYPKTSCISHSDTKRILSENYSFRVLGFKLCCAQESSGRLLTCRWLGLTPRDSDLAGLGLLLLLLLSCFCRGWLCVTPKMAAHQAPPSMGFSRQEHWSGLPFPSPVHKSESEVAQSCPTLRDPMDCSLPGSSVHGIFQARVLEWIDIAFSEV